MSKEEEAKNKPTEARRRGASGRHAETSVLNRHGYKVLESVGKGSFADVRMAFSSAQRKNIAVKIISKDKITDKDFIRKFVPREIRVLRQLNHPNIIRFYKSIETVKTIFIFMELAENGDLLQIIKKEKMIDEKRACRWFHHLVDGVAHLHSRGVAHRDLKCENLLLDKYYVVKITDFGFTRDGLPIYLTAGQVENKTREKVMSSTFCGSFAYASPEVLKGIPYEPNLSDVWSMGVVLYIMVYGRLPFDDTNWNGLLKQVCEPVGFPSVPEVSETCKRFIQDILSPLSIRIYIPEIRKNEWYIKSWDIQLDRMYQRKHRWELEEKATTRGFEQTPYKGKGRDITRYERVATLRKYISEKERLGALKKKVKAEEAKLEEMKTKATALKDEINAEKKEAASLEATKATALKDEINAEKKVAASLEAKDPLIMTTIQESESAEKIATKTLKTTLNEQREIDQPPETCTDNLAKEKQLGQQEPLQTEKALATETPRSPLPLSEVDAPIPVNPETGVQAEHNEPRTHIENVMPANIAADIAQPSSERHFKDINEAILEKNRLIQLSSTPNPTCSRTKEISSHRFCRKDDSFKTLQMSSREEIKGKDIHFLKPGEPDTLRQTFATDMVLECEEDIDKDPVIAVVEMPETMDEQEIKQIELKDVGTDSHTELLKIIKQMEEGIDVENDELISRYKRILQEELEEEEISKLKAEEAKQLAEEANRKES